MIMLFLLLLFNLETMPSTFDADAVHRGLDGRADVFEVDVQAVGRSAGSPGDSQIQNQKK